MAATDDSLGRRERKKLEVKARLVQATTDLLSRKALEDITMEEICELGDVSRKTFYNHFPSKQDVIEVISQKLLLDVSDKNYESAMHQFTNTKQRLAFFLEQQGINLSDNLLLQQNLIKHAMLDMAVDSDRSRAKLESNIVIFQKMLDAGVTLGDVNDKYSTRFLAEMVAGAINTSAIHWIHFPDYPVNKRYKELMDFILEIALKN